ncbi:MAG: prephenate/arogenate dehydrogenase [Oculatellaceae cyanobacterium Prado106]|nr:prephenate/arogenate dehydrogenase [Oculatellaceae cyanobacterium Prado106]
MRIGIVGLGLIGGSMAIDLKALGHRVLGVSRRGETCELAIARGIVDAASPDFGVLAEAELVVLCTPLGAIASTLEKLLPHLDRSAILTDVGSTKVSVVETVVPRWPNFVGGHPMAGTAESGLEAAFAGLFVDRPYVLTPLEETPQRAIAVVEEMARSLQSRVYFCSPTHHDQAVAWISHLPVMVSASLIAACMQEFDPKVLELAQQLASSGFRDTSRVGGGNPELGVMMAQFNRGALGRSLRVYRQQLDQLIEQIDQEDWSELEHRLSLTQQARPKFVE